MGDDKSITDESKEKWMSVPAFGDWEKLKGMPDYSMDFSKIREKRKQSKSDCSQISMGNEADLLSRSIATSAAPSFVQHERQTSPGKKTLMSYFGCCGANIISS